MQNAVYTYILIFFTGMLGIWKAVPLGIILKANPVMIWLLTSAGASASIVILYFFGNRIRGYIQKRRAGKGKNKKETRAKKILDKYGAPGLGLIGCLVIGPNMTIILGLVLVKSGQKLFWWTLIGVFVWSLMLTITAVFSIELFEKINGWL